MPLQRSKSARRASPARSRDRKSPSPSRRRSSSFAKKRSRSPSKSRASRSRSRGRSRGQRMDSPRSKGRSRSRGRQAKSRSRSKDHKPRSRSRERNSPVNFTVECRSPPSNRSVVTHRTSTAPPRYSYATMDSNSTRPRGQSGFRGRGRGRGSSRGYGNRGPYRTPSYPTGPKRYAKVIGFKSQAPLEPLESDEKACDGQPVPKETLPEQDSAVEPIDMTDETASSTEAATFDATVEATDTIPTDSTAAAVTREDDPSENELESEELATGVSTAPPKIR